VHAGHGLTFDTVAPFAAMDEVRELNIGHFLIGRGGLPGAWPRHRRNAPPRWTPRDDPRHRHRSGQHRADRRHAGAVRRPLPRPRVHRDRAAQGRTRRDVAGTYAKRWAAKEACSKALGTGLRMGIAWRDMAVRNLPPASR
jgi:hypothetical protein